MSADAIGTGIFTLAGIAVGSLAGWLLGNRAQLKADKRAAFVELLASLDACSFACIRVLGTPTGTPEIKVQIDAAVDCMARVDSARGVVALMLPSRERHAIDAAVSAATNAVADATERATGTRIARIEGAPTIHAAWEDVLALAKRELGYKD